MKTAKELFEAEGFIQNLQDDYIEYHQKDMNYPFGYYEYVFFNFETKTWRSNIVNPNAKILNAIIQQVKELGWNKE